ncbi:hypothetical protein ABZ642_03410 [Streptomyces sp. NPDC007157]|uniref:hypothetical protein n=1 Tax=Streptomyces sp. NPDC007157 TaxID=3154681 RepID=UPI0033FC0B53
MRLPQAGELAGRLQQRGVVPVAVRADEDLPDVAGGERDEYRGIGILWVDDRPENNTHQVNHLRAHGAEVLLAPSGPTAERILVDAACAEIRQRRS